MHQFWLSAGLALLVACDDGRATESASSGGGGNTGNGAGGTGGAGPTATSCAVMYADANLQGASLNAGSGSSATIPASFNDAMSSVYVAPGCTLTAYAEANLQGAQVTFAQTSNIIPAAFNDQMSSFTCSCTGAPGAGGTTGVPGGGAGGAGGAGGSCAAASSYCASCNVCLPQNCAYWCAEGTLAGCSSSPSGLQGCTGPVHSGCDCSAAGGTSGGSSSGASTGKKAKGSLCLNDSECASGSCEACSSGAAYCHCD